MKKGPKNVDAYIASTPKEVRGKLNELRSIIRKAAPNATESISYGMPYYSYKGRLVYFRLAKAHIGLYVPTPVLEELKDELGNYYATKATMHLPLDKKLPAALIGKVVKARMRKNWRQSPQSSSESGSR